MLLNSFTFHAPTKLQEAGQLYTQLPEVKILAGGTFLLNNLKLLKRKGLKTPKNILSLKKVPELHGIQADEKEMVINSMTTIDELFESDLLTDNFKVFRSVCRNISTQPIRNVATVGGNLTCRYTWTEMPAVMIGLEADLHFIDAQGKESTVTAEEFFKNAAKTDKILARISVKRDKEASIAYRRVRKTTNVDIPLLSLIIKTKFSGNRFTNTRVVVNNCVNFAQRDTVLEDFLNQSSVSGGIAQEALDHVNKSIYDTRSSEYKQHIFRVNLKNAINELIQNRTKK